MNTAKIIAACVMCLNIFSGNTLIIDANAAETDDANAPSIYRIAGENRYETSLMIAEYLRAQIGSGKFDNVILSSGENYPDALGSACLSEKLNAPLVLINEDTASMVADYLNQNMTEHGKVYVLGGEKAVAGEWLEDIRCETVRLAGADRYETNLEIIKAADVKPEALIICTGTNYADCLSASATDMPVLLVGGEHLTDKQKEWLSSLELSDIYVAGGTKAVSVSIWFDLYAFGYGGLISFEGGDRFDTSGLVAEYFFGEEKLKNIVVAYGYDYPDGLCGGALARALDAPVLLADPDHKVQAQIYAGSVHPDNGYVLGGTARLDDQTVREIFGLDGADEIILFE